MGRWRPPQPKSSPYITAKGLQALKAELDHLWTKRRPEVVRALSAAAAEGDRSENAEYQYRKRELAGIDRRVRYLQKRIPDLKPVGEPPSDPNKVFFGAFVGLEGDDGEMLTFRIVGPDEIDPDKQYISMDSPMAKQLLGKSLDDEVAVKTPEGERHWCVVEVSYEA
ncbi:MAG: transcription elongation factor GreB [Gammaproteobacteria bacterium]|nr:transcription elongation factor GreB [Gammaproteobacteria bacterium]